MQVKIEAIDFETHLITKYSPIPKPVCLSFANSKHSGIFIGMYEMSKYLTRVLSDDNILLLAHNIAFEALVILKYFPKEIAELLINKLDKGLFICTQMAWQSLQNLKPNSEGMSSLDVLVKHYFSVDIKETKTNPHAWRLRYSELDGVPRANWPEEAVKYSIDDSEWTLKCYLEMQKELPEACDLTRASRSQVALNWFGKTGMQVDHDKVDILEKEVLTYIDPARIKLLEYGLIVKHPKTGKETKSTKAIEKYIMENIPPMCIKRTKKNTIETKEETLTYYLDKYLDKSSILHTYQTLKEYEKVLTTYVKRLKQASPFIYADYNSVVATGRTSCRQSSLYPSVNIQNQPRGVDGVSIDVRNCYIPREGYKLMPVDYAGLELAACGHQLKMEYGHSAMADLINKGEKPIDLHMNFAAFLKNVTYEYAMERKKDQEWKAFRQFVKEPHLGKPGGLGYDTTRKKMANLGIYPYYEVIKRYKTEKLAEQAFAHLRKEFDTVRVQRTGKHEWSVVLDELVETFRGIYNLYPELKTFLKVTHEEFMNGKTMRTKNDFGEWEDEPAYRYEVGGTVRDYCSYTALCNGYLMQSPSANGAKDVAWMLFKEFWDSNEVRVLAFIHDEFIFEVLDCPHIKELIMKVNKIMLDGMQKALYSCRIATEWAVMDYWQKSGNFELEGKYFKNVNETIIREL